MVFYISFGYYIINTYTHVTCRRHTPYGNQTDYRIFELNKRLQNWTEVGKSFLLTVMTHCLNHSNRTHFLFLCWNEIKNLHACVCLIACKSRRQFLCSLVFPIKIRFLIKIIKLPFVCFFSAGLWQSVVGRVHYRVFRRWCYADYHILSGRRTQAI